MTADGAVVALLARLLPAAFRERQRAEWAADLSDLAAHGPAVRLRYLLAAAWTLPELRSAVRADRAKRLSWRGLRAGLGRPGNPGIVVLAVLVSVLAGLFGAAGATRIGWEFAAPLPAGEQADAIKRTVFPGVTVIEAPLEGPEGERVEFGGTGYAVDPAGPGDIGALVPGLADRLVAAGWRIVEHPDASAPGFALYPAAAEVRAVRGGLKLYYDGGTAFTVGRAVPSWMVWVAVAGAVFGALVGWLVTGWAGRRAAEGSAAAQLAGMLTWPTVIVMLVLLLGRLLGRPGGQTWQDMFYDHLLYIVGGSPRWVGVVALAAMGVIAALGRRRTPEPT
ncbi:hypothetical protein [Actinoplanes sp. GCM10030250]|uniref:hypothetical protein n=1 Tax=Actinoplanes sp. GCM10030250 TaxID=3273376 RepID=UPI0036074940